jgi:tetratricopeptide (TPR) repeat protein
MIRQQKPQYSETPAPTPDLLSRRTVLIAAVCVVAAVFAVYGPSLNFQFILDDHRFTGDPRLQSAGHVWEYFTNYVWAQFPGGPATFYRPVFVLWLRINFILSEMSPWGWHLLSIAKHVAVGVVLGWLTWELLRDRTAALLAGTLFALHPAQSESVAWVTVPDPLMSAGLLAALLLYDRYNEAIRAKQEDLASSGRRSRKATRAKGQSVSPTVWLCGSATVYFAALLTKETAVVFPAVIFLLALLVVPAGPEARVGRKDEERHLWPRTLYALRQTLPFVAATLLYFLLRVSALGGKFGAQSQHLPWSTVVLSWPATLWFYSRALLWPIRSYAYADPIQVESFSVRGVLLPCVGVGLAIAAVAGATLWAWRKAQGNVGSREAAGVERALVIGTSLLVLPILPALDLNALNPGDFLHGRYVYLPAAGLMLLLATGWHLAGKARGPLLAAAGVMAMAFAALTVSQEKQWRDDLTVYTVAHELAPHNGPVARNLANARVQAALQLAVQGRCREAVPVFEQVTRDYPGEWFAWAGLGECFVQLNDLPKAEEALHRAADLSHEPQVVQQWQAVRSRMREIGAAARN